jgi:hypothetical protein
MSQNLAPLFSALHSQIAPPYNGNFIAFLAESGFYRRYILSFTPAFLVN